MLVGRLRLALLEDLLLLHYQVFLSRRARIPYPLQAAAVDDIVVDGLPEEVLCARWAHASGGGVEG